MHDTMESSAGIYRNGNGLQRASARIAELQQEFTNIKISDDTRTFNTELTAALELSFMLDVAQCIIESALKRTESRGAHQRTDFAKRDDQNFLKHSMAYRNPDGSTRIEYSPVKITRWPPGERVYGVKAEAIASKQ